MLNPQGQQQGFSLIELLIAIMVIVLLTSVVSLNIGSGRDSLEREQEVRQLAALFGYAQSEAEFSGIDHGLFIERNTDSGELRYVGHWLREYDQGWSDPRGSADVLGPFRFQPGVDLILSLVGMPDMEITSRDPELNPPPQIRLFAGGEITEGELDWIDRRSGELLYRLRWDLFGRMTLMPGGEERIDDLR